MKRRCMMKRIIPATILVVAFLLAFVPISKAEMAKEGSASGTVTYTGSHQIIPLDKERFVIKYENFGVRVSDDKESPLHGMSTHNIGVMYFENGIGRLRGYIFNIDKDGDKIIMELTEEASQLAPKPTSGKGKIIGGTGKFKGIQGSMEYTRRNMYPAAKGTHQAISRGKVTWKIVEPAQ
jgi:hypothetical protein